jgi:hypothetical protein
MARARRKSLNLLDIFFSLSVDSRGTLRRAFSDSHFPPFLVTTLCLFLAGVILPPLLQTPDAFQNPGQVALIQAVITTTLVSIFTTGLLTIFAFRIFHGSARSIRIFALWIYSLAPITAALLIVFALNKLLQGELTVLTYISSGYHRTSDITVALLPYALRGAALVSLVVFSTGTSLILGVSRTLAILVTGLGVPILLGSYVFAVALSDFLYPGIAPQVNSFFSGFLRIN